MSPRSEELLDGAKEALRGARGALDADAPARAASSAYYAMLYAARAALSERDLNARTHGGTWQLFREQFVVAGSFDAQRLKAAQDAQDLRELGDYRGRQPSAERAREVLDQAEEFVKAVEAMLR